MPRKPILSCHFAYIWAKEKKKNPTNMVIWMSNQATAKHALVSERLQE